MYSFRKNKKGFTLIELMVVVAIIGVLALLGLRLYSGQQEKAKNAIVKANTGTVQTLIQANMADWPSDKTAQEAVTEIVGTATKATAAGMRNPFGGASINVVDETSTALDSNFTGTPGCVYVLKDPNASILYKFYVQGSGKDGKLVGDLMTAQR